MIETYWADSNGRRNTCFILGDQELVVDFCGVFQPSAFCGPVFSALERFSTALNRWGIPPRADF